MPVPFCDTPWQSVAAAVGGGAAGGALGVATGLDPAGTAALAGLLGGAADVGAHLLRRDDQFSAAVARLRRAVGAR